MAQQLASQSSWADTYAPATPATTVTPSESIADSQSQLDITDPPPSYEAARLERDLPPLPRARQENVRQHVSSPVEEPAPEPPRDVEVGDTTPLLYQDQGDTKTRRRKQKRFIVVFLILAVWLMAIQCFKGISTVRS